MERRQEVVDPFTRGGRLLLLNGLLAPPPQILLTGGTLRHRMSAPRVHLLMRPEPPLGVEALATHVALIVAQLRVNRFDVHLQILRPTSAEDAAVVGASEAFPSMRLPVFVTIRLIR